MSFLRFIFPTTAAMLFVAAVASADPPVPIVNPVTPPGGGAAAGEMTIDQVLDALDQRGQDLQGFDAKVSLTETDDQAQLSATRTGTVRFQKKPSGDARLRVVFDRKQSGDKILNEKMEYALDGGWLTDRDYQKRIEVRRQVLRPGEKVNLLKLGEGPFPLPIGQKKEDVKKQFDVTKERPSKEDPPGTVHVLLKPVKETRYAKKFAMIDVWMDGTTHFPVRIDTTDPKQQNTKSTVLRDVRVNPALDDADFTPEKISAGQWNIHEEPFSE